MSLPKSVGSWLLFLLGLLFIGVAAFIDHSQYQTILQLEKGTDLEWGPALFRGLMLLHGTVLIAVVLLRARFEDPVRATDENESPNFSLSRAEVVFLLVLTLVATALRIPNLDSPLWVDEVLTLVDFVRAPWGEVISSFPNQNQHMLYTISAKISSTVFGESAWSVRLPAVLFGVGSLWALYLLCRKLIGVPAAMLGSVLMMVSYHHVWFSQNARGYTGLLLFSILATWIWLEALERGSWKLWVVYSLLVAFGMWVHMTMAFVLAGHGAAFLAGLFLESFRIGRHYLQQDGLRRAFVKPVVAWLIAVSVTLQLYALALPEFFAAALHEESRNSIWTDPSWVVGEIVRAFDIGAGGIIVVSAGLAFLGLGLASLFRKNRHAAILMVFSPFVSGAVMLMAGHNLFPRFFFFAAGFAILIVLEGASVVAGLAARAVGIVYSNEQLPSLMWAALIVLMILVSSTTVPKNYYLPKQDFPSAYDYVEENRADGDEVVAVSIAGNMYSKYFGPDWLQAENVEDLKKIQTEHKKLWLVYTLSPEIKAFHPEMWKIIESDYVVVMSFPGTLNGGEVVVSRRQDEGDNERK
ncbi:MAG: hypothetical protein DWQ47_01910 [Acidobacteria bacterium]|nr:MAG: hypothetical protein DWQ32_05460 [Acidobacteriota bacterium]REK01179.1 MAG: hypothetical protein DWQ38_01895 [Acidobacteriota bacterium]REK14135.1 MAG: hypothetical protein DWQ43_11150 [Acidobacteriota bacterium]REK44850.1 MAG: hypothetical protein DWQ47_01910 [Acidobacteriota bacterium]